MRETLRVAAVQVAASLDPQVNRDLLHALTPRDSDLVVFPEAFARDFGEPGSDVAPFAESVDGPFAGEVERVAKTQETTILAGMFEASTDPTRPWNTLVLRGASHANYRKIHLYDSFGYRESDRLTAGEPSPRVVTLGAWKLGLMTCYDLRFPELSRELVAAGADVLVIPAAWVAGPRKVDHWRTMVRARAIENSVFVVAVGQSGPRYCGHSLIVDPIGDILAEATDDKDQTLHAVLNLATIEQVRAINPSLANRRL
jgi:deaminated glutathione amidase